MERWKSQGLTVLLLLVLWEITARVIDSVILLPTVVAVFKALIHLVVSGALFEALRWSFSALLWGFLIGSAAGLVLGFVMGVWPIADRALGPYANALYATPLVALVPVVVLWFGVGLSARVFFVTLWVLFPVLINTFVGARSGDAKLQEVAVSFGARGWPLLRHVIWPYTVPFLLTGLRLGVGRALIGLIIAEMFLQQNGLGRLLAAYGASFSTDYVFALILVLPVLNALLTGAVKLVEDRLLRWHPSMS